MKVLSIVGARPQFVKLAPGAEAFARGIGPVSGGSGGTITIPLGSVGNTVTWDSELAGAL